MAIYKRSPNGFSADLDQCTAQNVLDKSSLQARQHRKIRNIRQPKSHYRGGSFRRTADAGNQQVSARNV